MVLTVYTNETNPSTLKILVAANFSKAEVNLKIVSSQERELQQPRHLPYLELEDSCNLFIPNAAAKFLFPSKDNEEVFVNEWLEWESSVLSPNIALLFGFPVKIEDRKEGLKRHLHYLNDAIRDFSTSQKQIIVSDVVIWSTLYPFYKDTDLSKEYLPELDDLNTWIKKLEQMEEFQKAVNGYEVKPGQPSYQVLLNSSKYLSPVNLAICPPCPSRPSIQTQTSIESVSVDDISKAKESWLKGSANLSKPKSDIIPVLPKPGEKNVLITSALPYVNNVPHLGNIIGCVLSADVFARYCRLCNYNTLFICGTDEYGTATETKALEEGLTPQQICDKYFEVHNSIYRWFNIGFDYFGRTTTPQQTILVQEMFQILNKNGFMFTETVDQLLCQKCNRYLADRFVEGGCPHLGCLYEDARGDQCDGCGKLVNATELRNPRCKVCGTTPVIRSSNQFFFDLPKLEPLLLCWMKQSSTGWSSNARIIGNSWLKEGLKPRCITRDLKWGVPVPLEGFRDKVFYVWFDAVLGYISITQRYTKEWAKWWKPEKGTEVKLYQFMAKDNVPFHAVIFPAILKGVNDGFITVSHIMATEYLNYEDGKFSKSRGIGVFGNDAQNTGIPSDVWRFYLLYVRPESQDSSFSWADLVTKNNSELLNNLGNFINRALVFAEKFFDSHIPNMNLLEDDFILLAQCTKELQAYVVSLENGKLRDGIRHILSISRYGNQYMQSMQPWVLVKGTSEDKERAGTVVGVCCNLVCLLATLLFPYMPETGRTIRNQLNAPNETFALTSLHPEIVQLLPSGHKLGKPVPLFAKIELSRVEELKTQFSGKQADSNGASKKEDNLSVTELEEAIKKQGDKVRNLKASGVEKAVWQPEVNILLDLKKKLEIAQKGTNIKQSSVKILNENGVLPCASPEEIKKLEERVQKQGDHVRQLKSSGSPKSEWQPQVNILLQLKARLAAALGAPPAKPDGKGKKSKN
ncbi:methionine--tRNA ligase, cytoplasmic [Agrilus planipennis]|uniref:Methionine--tRNA ligase, cytoplasmic n=1 Tax=Agrilus planipennis TaxID=224129 RepID=A0A1W4X8J2_AGRPL|nr:methionine--tRNA ligase, cytoplasmic [Agrilus planipennis]